MKFTATLKNAFGKASSDFKATEQKVVQDAGLLQAKAQTLETTTTQEAKQIIEVIKEIPTIVEKETIKYVEVPVEKIVEVIKEVPVHIEVPVVQEVEKIVEKIKEVEKIVPHYIDRIVVKVKTPIYLWGIIAIETVLLIAVSLHK